MTRPIGRRAVHHAPQLSSIDPFLGSRRLACAGLWLRARGRRHRRRHRGPESAQHRVQPHGERDRGDDPAEHRVGGRHRRRRRRQGRARPGGAHADRGGARPRPRLYARPAPALGNLHPSERAGDRPHGGADLRIRVVRREEADSTLTVLRDSMPGWKDLAITERSKLATSTQEAIETVRLVDGAIGFGPFTKLLEHGTVVLRIDGHHPTDRGYPSSVVVAFIHTDATVTSDAKAFMSFAASATGKDIVRSYGGVPVN